MAVSDIPTTMSLVLNTLFLLSRYLHIIAAMVLVGGFLFYEMVVPAAIDDLKETMQIAVFAKARWMFRRVIFWCIALILVTGIYMTVYRMQSYIITEFPEALSWADERLQTPWILRTGWWWAAHVVSAGFAIIVALHLVSGDRMPTQPLGWIKLDLMLMLIVIFFATVTRQVDTIQQQRMINALQFPQMRVVYRAEEVAVTTQPTTFPATQP